MPDLLEIREVVAAYDYGPPILRGVSLGVGAGEIHCLIGPNGAGKSTLLRTVAGLLHLRSGEIRFRGERIDGLRPDEIVRRGLCFVPQERALFPRMTVRENLRMGGYVLDDRRETERRIAEALELFPVLGACAPEPAGSLSGGQQQMLALARALIVRPALVMLDEPSLGLAPKVVREVFAVVRRLRAAGMTVLIVEQNAIMGLGSADRGSVLDLGRTVFGGPAGEILADPRIATLYLGRGARAA